jgi:hypothetical protein
MSANIGTPCILALFLNNKKIISWQNNELSFNKSRELKPEGTLHLKLQLFCPVLYIFYILKATGCGRIFQQKQKYGKYTSHTVTVHLH